MVCLADMYSFGVVVWELVSGESLVRGNAGDVMIPFECPPVRHCHFWDAACIPLLLLMCHPTVHVKIVQIFYLAVHNTDNDVHYLLD